MTCDCFASSRCEPSSRPRRTARFAGALSRGCLLSAAALATWALAGCGDDASGDANDTGAPEGGADAAGTPGAAGALAAGQTGGGQGGAGAAGTSGSAAVSCTGTWGDPVDVFADPPFRVHSPSVTGDGLELFYVRQDPSSTSERFAVTRRATSDAPFGPGEEVEPLNAACSAAAVHSIHVTYDGLRVYLGCPASFSERGPLHVAERASRMAAFTVRPAPIGNVAASVSLSADERVAFSSSDNFPGAPLQYMRDHLDASFSPPQRVPGLETAVLSTPFLSPDGLTLLGAHNDSLVTASRLSVDAPFDMPAVLMQGSPSDVLGVPNVGPDCRTLYYVRVTIGPDAALDWRVQRMIR
jgi:hypothetical protein